MWDPAYDLLTYFESLGIGSRTPPSGGWRLVWPELLPSDTKRQIACVPTGAFAGLFDSEEGEMLARPTVQVLILGDKRASGAYETARAKADEVLAAVRHRFNVIANGHLYQRLSPLQSDPVWLGFQSSYQDRALFSVNVLMEYEQREA